MDRSIFTKKVETAAASYVEAFYAECTALSDDDLIDALRVAHETIDNASDARNQAMRSGFLSDYDPVLALAHLWAAECCARNRSIPIIHHFRTSRDAYDACQCSDQIKDGDFLLIRSEGVLRCRRHLAMGDQCTGRSASHKHRSRSGQPCPSYRRENEAV